MASRRGAFILLEGVDRCGKTTQCAKLVQALNEAGRTAKQIRFPDRTTSVGSIINSYLQRGTDLEDHSIHLLFSANRWEAKASIEEALAAGTTLVCDRYSHSGVAFSSAKDGMSLDWCMEAETGLPAPDVVLFLSLPEQDAEARGGFGEERYEETGMQRRVREQFAKLQRKPGVKRRWVDIDARGSIEEVHDRIMQACQAAMAAADQGSPVETLWGGPAAAAGSVATAKPTAGPGLRGGQSSLLAAGLALVAAFAVGLWAGRAFGSGKRLSPARG